MINWSESMEQTFEFYKVEPNTWEDDEKITSITSATFNRDLTNETLGSASIDTTEFMDECYIRGYIVVKQNGIEQKFALGTVLVQTPSDKFDGKLHTYSLDAYTPLVELKTNNPPIGYSIMKKTPIMETAALLCSENMRAPIVSAEDSTTLENNFVSDLSDTWMSYLSSLVSNAKYEFGLDERGQVIFNPIQEVAKLQPVWVYTDDNFSILLPDITNKRDLYNVPNVVEVVYSTGTGYLTSRVENNDPNSPVSIKNRGRQILYRDTNPNIQGDPSQAYLDDYAKQLLKSLSCMERTITYSHGYCPTKLGDCIVINSEKANLVNVKAKVVSQSIKCNTGCIVNETATFTEQLWG